MAIDRFTKDRFEEALPKHKLTGEPLWHDIGFYSNEFVYGMHVEKNGVKDWVTINIRSSVDMDGLARDAGEDSIRLFFLKNGEPHGSKLSCYITRVKGWEERLIKQLRMMYKRGMRMNVCPLCNGPKAIFKKAKGKQLFQACPVHFSVTYENYKE